MELSLRLPGNARAVKCPVVAARKRKAKPEDLVVFYFSGHVLAKTTTKRLLAYDFDDDIPQLRAVEIVSLFGKCAGKVVVIVDG